jgi:hypothetical protein
MAEGMNWGILSLLAIVVAMLGGVAGFFVFLARRSAPVVPGVARSPRGAQSAVRSQSEPVATPQPAALSSEPQPQTT